MVEVIDRQSVTQKMRSFYAKYPFPNYEGTEETLSQIVQKGMSGGYTRTLNEEIPYGVKILDVGCGTGQLPFFLGKGGARFVVGADLTFQSLSLAQKLKENYGINRVHFSCMDLFHPALKEASFDYLFCNGVLHHTTDPRGGFKALCRLVKPGGYLLIGLYNRYARLTVYLKGLLFRIWPPQSFRNPKDESWYRDQYENPWESVHSVGEVLHWFEEEKIDFVSCWPGLRVFHDEKSRKVFQKEESGNPLRRLLVQLGWIFTRGKDGGYFLMVGKKTSGEK